MAYAQILQRLLQNFFVTMGRAPLTPTEWSKLRARAMNLARKEGGDPITGSKIQSQPKSLMDTTKDLPTLDVQSQTADIIPFSKALKSRKMKPMSHGLKGLMQKGHLQLGKAPKTLPEHLKAKKDRGILLRDADEDLLRIKRENKEAIERFKQKMDKKPDIPEFAGGGIAPLVGEPSYAADFYDDRIPMAGGGALWKFIQGLFIKASNDIRQGKGKWKGLDQKQRMVQHDNLTKKVEEFQKTGNTEGLEVYFDVNPHQAFAKAEKQVSDEKFMQQAYDEIAGGSGFTGDYKYDADILADSLATVQGKVYDDLTDLERSGLYDQALKRVSQDMLKRREAKKLSKPTKTLEGIKEKGTIDISDPEVADEFSRFMKESDPEGFKDIEQKIQIEGYDVTGRKKNASGGRAEFIFGGSAGLKEMWKQMLKSINKGRDKPIKRLFPTLSARDRALEKVVMGTPEQKAFREGEKKLKLEGIDLLIDRLKHDKKIIERQAKNKAMADPGLDFLMKDLEKSMSDVYGPHLKKYTDIDKDILDMETIKKNLIMKDRKLNAEGGRVSYSGGGRAGLPAVTMGTPQMNMQGPQMPAGPQPAGISGANLQMNLMQQKMQQNPWMQNQGMQNPPYKGQFRMPFKFGGMDKSRRAFLKWLAGITGGGIAAGTGMLKLGKMAPKVSPKVTETAEVITRGADGMPAYITDLISVVKAKGTRDIIEGFKKSDYSTVHSYKGVDVTEDALGNIKIKSDRGGVATDPYTGKTHEGISQEHHMQIEKGQMGVKDEGLKTQKAFQEPDEYIEGTVRPDMDGKMKDFEEGLDEDVHEFFKEIADEVDTLVIKKTKKASGGLAHLLGE